MLKFLRENSKEQLGLEEMVGDPDQGRFLNKDGTFRARRLVRGLRNTSLYHSAINAHPLSLLLGIWLIFMLANLVFALLYLAAGREAFPAIAHWSILSRFGELYSYSIQVITTLGSSPLKPEGWVAHMILGFEGFIGMLGFAVLAGLIFARFANPAVKIKFSKHALITHYEKGTALMFRIINERSDELIDVEAEMAVSILDETGKRRFYELELERTRVALFPLSWTIVHPITEQSPLWDKGVEDLQKKQMEIFPFITAVDENLSRKVYAKSSYIAQDLLYGRKFAYIVERDESGRLFVDPDRLDDIEPAEV